MLDFSETEGAVTGRLLPTGNPVDTVAVSGIGDVEMSIIDAGNPGCYIRPEVLNLSGTEGPLDKKIIDQLDRIERIRGAAAKLMGIVDDASRAREEKPATPFLAIVSPPESYRSYSDDTIVDAEDIDLAVRPFYMQEMHKAIGGTMTVCTGAAAKIKGTVVNAAYHPGIEGKRTVRIGHASGIITIETEVEMQGDGPHLTLAAFGRTSRRIMEGCVYVPEHLLIKPG
jgi:2-methylaconitate cis-trans-isomerase PrpF